MSQQFAGYTVTSSNGSSRQKCSVTVKNEKGQVCARVYSDTGRMLTRMRKYLLCDERLQLIDQLARSGTPKEVIEAIVSL